MACGKAFGQLGHGQREEVERSGLQKLKILEFLKQSWHRSHKHSLEAFARPFGTELASLAKQSSEKVKDI